MNLNSISILVKLQDNQNVTGNNSKVTSSNNDTSVFASVLSNSSNDIDISELEAEYEETVANIANNNTTSSTNSTSSTNATKSTSATSSTSSVSSTSSTSSTSSSEAIKEEIEELEEEKEKNMDKMDKIEDKIEDLAKSAEEHIKEAAKAQEKEVENYDEESKKVLSENINAYIEANKEGGEGMTRDELQKNIQGALPDVPGVADALAALTAASEEVDEIDSLLGDLNTLLRDTQDIENQIDLKQTEYDAAVEAEKAAEAAKCCDPIGFTTTDANGNQAQYDFIVDDGNFDSTSDFLGSDNQWASMQALDTDGDNVVTSDELKAGNIKAVKTNSDGSQQVVDLSDEFGDDFSIDLSSYNQGGSHSSIDTTSDSDGDGIANQSLLGTFNLNINGQTVSGYNTLDDTDWLADNYGVSGAESVETADSSNSITYSDDLQSYANFFNIYTEKSAALRSEIEDGYESIGLTKEQMEGIQETTKIEASQKAQEFYSSLETKEDDDEENQDNEENKENTTTDASSTKTTYTSLEEINADNTLTEDEKEKETRKFKETQLAA
jgi:hypothetical protein